MLHFATHTHDVPAFSSPAFSSPAFSASPTLHAQSSTIQRYIQLYSPECTLAEKININNNKQNKDRNILCRWFVCCVVFVFFPWRLIGPHERNSLRRRSTRLAVSSHGGWAGTLPTMRCIYTSEILTDKQYILLNRERVARRDSHMKCRTFAPGHPPPSAKTTTAEIHTSDITLTIN